MIGIAVTAEQTFNAAQKTAIILTQLAGIILMLQDTAMVLATAEILPAILIQIPLHQPNAAQTLPALTHPAPAHAQG